MSMQVILSGVEGVIRDMQAAQRGVERDAERAMYRIGATVKDRAQEYAPISPTVSQLRGAQTGTKRQKAAGKKRRLASATTRAKPGSLQNSIRFTSTAAQADIFVPSNSPAGKYAKKIHDDKGTTWRNRGIGTQMKGAQADDKFIARAIKDSEREIEIILNDQLGRSLPR